MTRIHTPLTGPRIAGLGILIFLASIALYWPGLAGSFLLDDQANLSNLQKLSAPLTLEQLQAFVASGNAGPLGRPVAMFSFALQFDAWPGDPAAFKLVNLLLHLANGGLVFWLAMLLGGALPAKQRTLPALLVTAFWLLHPIQVSTTLYVIQRMTLLSAFFMLIGLAGIFQGRQLVRQGHARGGLTLATLALLAGGVLGILSKESAAMLPVMALVIEMTLFRQQPVAASWQTWKRIFLILPVLLGLAYFAFRFDALVNYAGRDFTLTERLLSEGRVLCDYLRKIVLVPPYDFGVYFDDFAVSRHWLSPPTTLPALALLALLGMAAYLARNRSPWLSFSVAWFFAGHLMESTVLPLELYFEHRNYLPAFGVLFGLVHGGRQLAASTPKLQSIYPLLATAFLIVLSGLTLQQTRLWGNSLAQALVWAQENPLSQRAQERAGVMLVLEGYPDQAGQHFARMTTQFPDIPDGPMLQLYLHCLYGTPVTHYPAEAIDRLRIGKVSKLAVSTFAEIVRIKESGRCGVLDHGMLQAGFDAALSNPQYAPQRPTLLVLQGRAQWVDGQQAQALASLDRAYALKRNKEIAFQQLLWARVLPGRERVAAYLQRVRESTTGNPAHDRLIENQAAKIAATAAE